MTRSLLLPAMLLACSPAEPGNGAAAPARTTENAVDSERNGAASGEAAGGAGGEASGEGVAGLPFSHGRSFRTLDEYLVHLELHAKPIDQPWWREIRPGVYEHVRRMPGAGRETATREELARRFGFSR